MLTTSDLFSDESPVTSHIALNLRLADSYAPPRDWPHGTPYRIDDTIVDLRDIAQAHAIVTRERTTLGEDESNRERTHLDELCERIRERAFGEDETVLVWYHPDTRDFWAYPRKAR